MPDPSASGTTTIDKVLLAGWLVLTVIQAVAFHGQRMDDAYISYRYAQNLVEGEGLVFNAGEKLMGSTAPGHVLISALAFRIVGRDLLPSVMSVLGVIAWMTQALLVYLLLSLTVTSRNEQTAVEDSWWRRHGAVTLAATIVALGAAQSHYHVSLETNIVMALGLGAVWFSTRGHWSAAAALAASAVVVRPDAGLIAGLLVLACLYDQRGRAFKPAIVFLSVALPWFVFAGFYFGRILPQSAARKFQVTSFAEYLGHTFRHPVSVLLPFDQGVVSIGFLWILAVGGALYLATRHRAFGLLGAWFVLHASAYLVLRPFTAHTWHLYPTTLLFVVFVLAGLIAGTTLENKAVQRMAGGLLWLGVLASGVNLLLLPVRAETSYWSGRHEAYMRVSDYLNQVAEPDEAVAAVEVGTISYYTGLRMVDMGGLITRSDSPGVNDYRYVVVDDLYLEPYRGLEAMVFEQRNFRAYLFDLLSPENLPRLRQRLEEEALEEEWSLREE